MNHTCIPMTCACRMEIQCTALTLDPSVSVMANNFKTYFGDSTHRVMDYKNYFTAIAIGISRGETMEVLMFSIQVYGWLTWLIDLLFAWLGPVRNSAIPKLNESDQVMCPKRTFWFWNEWPWEIYFYVSGKWDIETGSLELFLPVKFDAY